MEIGMLKAAVSPRLPWALRQHAVNCLACSAYTVCFAALAEACGTEVHRINTESLCQPGGSKAASEFQPVSQGFVKCVPRRVLISTEQAVKVLPMEWQSQRRRLRLSARAVFHPHSCQEAWDAQHWHQRQQMALDLQVKSQVQQPRAQ